MEFKIMQNDNHVATIEAVDLNAVFEIGNIGPEDKIERLAPMHSISVGDVIIDEDEKSFSVDSMKILVGCETSGTVRDAFLANGHDANGFDLGLKCGEK